MNPIYEQKKKEEREVREAIQKFVDAVHAFQKLNPNQKNLFFQNVVLQSTLAELNNDKQYERYKV